MCAITSLALWVQASRASSQIARRSAGAIRGQAFLIGPFAITCSIMVPHTGASTVRRKERLTDGRLCRSGEAGPASPRSRDDGDGTRRAGRPLQRGWAVYAIDDTCRHAGVSLGTGELRGTIVRCRAHGWRYDVTTGDAMNEPDCRVTRYPVQVVDGAILVDVTRTSGCKHGHDLLAHQTDDEPENYERGLGTLRSF
jgi:nitrite reductase/ring-hydroxylating ferredoxin subunit